MKKNKPDPWRFWVCHIPATSICAPMTFKIEIMSLSREETALKKYNYERSVMGLAAVFFLPMYTKFVKDIPPSRSKQ